MEQNTKHAARKTPKDRQIEKKPYTHDTDSWRQANRQEMCVRETKNIIGEAPRLGIHTLYQQFSMCCDNVLWEEYFRITIQQKFLAHCMEGVIVGCRVREVGAGMSR